MAQGNLPQQLARPQTDIPTQNRISILRHPNKVIFAIPYRMTARFRRLHRRMLCIPSPKGEGFTDPRKGTLNGRHAPGEKITYYPLYRNYCAAHPDFSREAGALLAENTKAANARKGARHRNMTHRSYGHPFEGTNLHYLPDGRRLCQTCQRRRNANPRPPSEAQIREATAAFHRVVAGKKTEKRILTFRKLKLYRKLNPEFDRFVASVIDSSNSRGQKRRVNPNKARTRSGPRTTTTKTSSQ